MSIVDKVINVFSGGASSVESSLESVPGATATPTSNSLTEFVPKPAGTSSSANTDKTGKPPFPNELNKYASMNYIFSLSCLTNYEINSPDNTYRVKDPANMILRSGGGLTNAVRTAYENNGRIEYFIDDVEIDSLITQNRKVKQTNATNITFKITEPYSMGIFLQTLQLSALRCGYSNYLEAPFLLTVDFRGWDDAGNAISSPLARRMFPLKLADISFEVTEGGSVYQVTAIPFNEQAWSDQVQTMKSDIQLQGKQVHQLCQAGGQSIAAQFNDREEKRRQDGQTIVPNEYYIIFPKDRDSGLENLRKEFETAGAATEDPGDVSYRTLSQDQKSKIYETLKGATNEGMPSDFDPETSLLLGIVIKKSKIGESIRSYAEDSSNVNEIGQAKLVSSYLDGHKQPFGKAKFVEVEDQPGVFQRGKIQVQADTAVLTFKSRTTIQDMIEELILLSDYGKKIAEDPPNSLGFKKWFKIEANVLINHSSKQEDFAGAHPKIFIYKVVPYYAHVNTFSSPKASFDTSVLQDQICKVYYYQYTGLNDEVLDFSISFDSAFYTSITAFAAKNKAGSKIADENAMAGTAQKTKVENTVPQFEPSSSGHTTLKDDLRATTGTSGGGLYDTDAVTVARDFNDAMMNSSTDLVSGELLIMGDPYFIADSGMGNYSSPGSAVSINLNEDGTMDYQSGDVHILLFFQSPIDIAVEGYADFTSTIGKATSSFAGMYKVVSVLNRFSAGEFTQRLSLLRVRNQYQFDTVSKPIEGNSLGNVILLPGGGTAAVEDWEAYLP